LQRNLNKQEILRMLRDIGFKYWKYMTL
jgi:hypothetical protein